MGNPPSIGDPPGTSLGPLGRLQRHGHSPLPGTWGVSQGANGHQRRLGTRCSKLAKVVCLFIGYEAIVYSYCYWFIVTSYNIGFIVILWNYEYIVKGLQTNLWLGTTLPPCRDFTRKSGNLTNLIPTKQIETMRFTRKKWRGSTV